MSQLNDMDALVWVGPGQMEIQRKGIPEPDTDEVLIAVRAAGICGSELSGYLGHNSLRTPPLVMGHEAAGSIVAGTEATLADGSPAYVGTRVTFNPLLTCGTCDRCVAGYSNVCRNRRLIGAHLPGAFAHYVAVPARQCYPLPDGLPETMSSLTEPLACSVRAVSLSHAGPAQSLLILGAGPIGLFCLIAASAMGITRIYVSDISEQRLAVAQQWQALATINAREHDVVRRMRQLEPGGVDAVIDAVGADSTRSQALQAVIPGGRVVFIGLHDEASPLAANYLVRQEITLIGCFAYGRPDFERAFSLITQGVFPAEIDWLEKRPLAEGGTAFAELASGQATATKVVLQVP